MNPFGISALSLLTAMDAKRNLARRRLCERTSDESDDPIECESRGTRDAVPIPHARSFDRRKANPC